MKDVMLDIETAGKGSKAAIISIGAVLFDPATGDTDAEFYQTVTLASSAHYGDIDPSTVIWWMRQPDEARAVFHDDEAVSLKEALQRFAFWLESHIADYKERVLWGNGPSFDNVILSNAYKAVRLRQPWTFPNDRCVRTMVDLGKRIYGIDPKTDMTFDGVPHNAVDDAKHQVAYLSAIFQRMQESAQCA